MPNITFNVAQPLGSNACGAFALAAALRAIPAVADLNYPIKLRHRLTDTGPSNCQVDIDGYECNDSLARKIYRITGDLELNLPSPGVYKDSPGLQNSPSALAYVARMFGRTVTVNVIANSAAQSTNCQCIATRLLAACPQEVARCSADATVNAPGCPTTGVPYAAPANDEVQLLCVRTTAGSMHWLTRGANGFYDPGDASINNGGAIDADGVMTGVPGNYVFTGIWIVLK
ncbi:hypothetical protein D3869_26215 (plasmid) [Azospirillum brasilense]|uniref:Uncharacterized protein n=1 Tax=Azospirillum brasilense TaxID=192 RepID=A0A4D8RE61_AZOBR|nr:hypothetical protein [Azospirillum brasilense]QCO18783.1 hypothetical protein D3869_26215 [Azospirillum brasilense]